MSQPQQKARWIECSSCELDLQHCHGAAVVRSDGTYPCSDDPDCTLNPDEHWFISIDED